MRGYTKFMGHHRSGTGRLLALVGTSIMAWAMLLHAVPAWADHFISLDELDVVCGSGMHLDQATGVPGGGVHTYAFGGACNLRVVTSDGPGTRAVPPVVASAHWDQASNTYTESLHLLAPITVKDIAPDVATLKVGTYPEVATFKCDVDPVINHGAHCTLETQHNETGWETPSQTKYFGNGGDQVDGFAWSANHNRPLLLGLATEAQAASLSHKKAHPSISCDGLKLQSVKDIKGIRSYHFDGTCELYHTPDGSGGLRLTHVLVSGYWNAAGQGAQETFNVLAPENEGGGLYKMADYNCAADPFVHGNVQCSLEQPLNKVSPVYDPITDLRAKHPIAAGKTTPAQVAKLVGPKRGPSLVNRKVTAGAHSNVKNLHLPQGPLRVNHGAAKANAHAGNLHIGATSPQQPASHIAPSGMHLPASSPARPGTMQAQTTLKLPAPNVRVLGERTIVDQSCHDTRKLIVIDATVRNDGGPLKMHQWELYVMEGGGADLSSGGVWVPPMGPRAEAHVSIPVLVLKSHIAQLPGTHWLKLISQGGGHKATTLLSPITLAQGICQPHMRMSSPAGMQLKANNRYPPSPCVGAKCQQAGHAQPGTHMALPNTKLNPQPEPPSAKQRIQRLPAVQFNR